MNLLLTNDDGFFAEGINSLYRELAKNHNVYIIAPHINRSSVSCCLDMIHKDLEIKKINEKIWSCSGYPCDCVVLGLRSKLIDVKIDAVVSGINNGANLGTDIIYSGTCAASRQSVLLNCPSVSFSLSMNKKNDELDYRLLSEFASKNLEHLVNLSKKNNCAFVNVNACSESEYKGIEFATSLCRREYNDSFELKNENGNMKASLINSPVKTEMIHSSDYGICQTEKISISLVDVNPVCFPVVDDLPFSL